MSEETETKAAKEGAEEETLLPSAPTPVRKKSSKKKTSKKKVAKKKASKKVGTKTATKKKATKKKASKKKASKKKASKKVSGRGPGRPPKVVSDESAPVTSKKKRRKKKASKKVSGRGPGRPPKVVSDEPAPVTRKKKRRKKKAGLKSTAAPAAPQAIAAAQAPDTGAERRVVLALDALREALGDLIKESRQKDEAIELIRKGIDSL